MPSTGIITGTMARIVYVIATLDRGGSESQLVHLATRLDRARFDPLVVCLTRGGPLEPKLAEAGVTTVILHKRHKVDLSALGRLTRLLRLFHPDLLHTWLFTANAYGRWAALRAGVTHLVASERSTDPRKPRLNRLIDRWLARRTDRIVANCHSVRDVYLRRLDLPPQRILVIPNGLQLQPADDDARAQLRAKEGLPDDALVFVTAGRLERNKAVDDLLRAFARLLTEVPQGYLIVLGGGPELAALAALADRLGVAERVIFLGQVADVAEVLDGADVFVFASLYEGLPNAVLEAMSAGLPVVTTAVGGIPEVVSDGETGFLVPTRRPEELAERMLRLARDGDLRRRLGGAARERVGEFTMERMVRSYEELYDGLLSGQLDRELTTEN